MNSQHSVQGITIAELAATYGTPLYVYDGDALRGQYQGLRDVLHPDVDIFYSLKSNPNIAICAALHELGAGTEVSSMAELETARRAGVPAERTMFLGPGKSSQELRACLAGGAGHIVCESFGELDLLDEMARQWGITAPVLLRINAAFSVKGAGLSMGGKPRQFGIDEDQLLADPGLLRRWPHLRVTGTQTYMGTRILDENVIAQNTARIFELARRAATRLGFDLATVDIGGGLGVAYFDGERDLDAGVLAAHLNPIIAEFRAACPHTRIVMELGRYLTAPAGIYVVRVRYTKTSMGERFAVADGGTNHHMAAVGIGSFIKRNFPIGLLNRADEPPSDPWNITGPLCTPNDTLVKAALLPPVRPGDLIGVFRSGAYGPSASPVLFLSHGHPAEVLVADGRHHLIRERDTTEDLLRKQRLPMLTPSELPV